MIVLVSLQHRKDILLMSIYIISNFTVNKLAKLVKIEV